MQFGCFLGAGLGLCSSNPLKNMAKAEARPLRVARWASYTDWDRPAPPGPGSYAPRSSASHDGSFDRQGKICMIFTRPCRAASLFAPLLVALLGTRLASAGVNPSVNWTVSFAPYASTPS